MKTILFFSLLAIGAASHANDASCKSGYASEIIQCQKMPSAKRQSCVDLAKSSFVDCCNVEGSSNSCSQDVISKAEQKNADDMCNLNYIRSAGTCNEAFPNNDVAFVNCLIPIKQILISCCFDNLGSADCNVDGKE